MTPETYLWEMQRRLSTLRMLLGESDAEESPIAYAVRRASAEAQRRSARLDLASLDQFDPIEATAE